MHAGEIAAALLKAHEEAFRLPGGHELVHHIADVLEPGEHPAHLHAPVLCHTDCHGGGHNAHHCHRILGHGALGGALPADIVQQQDTQFIAGEEPPAAVCLRGSHTDAVAVRVGGKGDVRLDVPAQIQGHLHGVGVLGVRGGTGGEIPVGTGLVRHHIDLLQACPGERRNDALVTGAVEG